MHKMQIKVLSPQDEARWDRFVDGMSEGTLFQKTAWRRIVAATFGYRAHYLFAERAQEICGILPLFHVQTWFAGNAVISTPFAVYGGVLAQDLETERALLNAANAFAHETGAVYLELRQRFACQSSELHTRENLYCTFIKPIYEDAEKTFSELPREARRMVRKAEKAGLVAKFENVRIDDFYDIYAASVRALGTPVFPRTLFASCLREFKDNADVLLVCYQGRPIAGVLSFYYRDTVLPYYGGSLPHQNHLAPNNFMYWALMKSAGERGYKFFDFGRSKNSTGAFHFKRHMGFEQTPLPYQYQTMNGAPLPNNNPTNPKFQFAIKMWQRLPLGLTKMLGPHLVRQFP